MKDIRNLFWFLIIPILIFSVMFSDVFVEVAANESEELSPELTEIQWNHKAEMERQLAPILQEQETIRVIVRLNTTFVPEAKLPGLRDVRDQRQRIEAAQDRVIDKMQSVNPDAIERMKTVPLLVMEIDRRGLEDLRNNHEVISIVQDIPVPSLLEDSIPLIGGNLAWQAGYSGSGQVVAVLDTGVDTAHEFLAGKTVFGACFSSIFSGDGASSLCPDGSEEQEGIEAGEDCSIIGCDHGTHVAGIAVGNGTSFSGVAKDANLISMQVFTRFDGDMCSGYGLSSPCVLSYPSDQIGALEKIYEERGNFNIASVNMSLGSGLYSEPCNTIQPESSMREIIQQLNSAGIAVVISAGNGGSRDSLSSPACISEAISVASTDSSDQVSVFSNVASFLDFFAPGAQITSSVPAGGYMPKSGTSMAAPFVSGAWAVLKSKKTDASVEEVYNALVSSGVGIDDDRVDGIVNNIPRIQVDLALDALPGESFFSYLAEGFTGSGFETFVLIQNPNDSIANLNVSYFLESGGVIERQHSILANSRYTIATQNSAEVGPDLAFSTRLDSDIPVIIERAMYFANGGHNTIGVSNPASTWYLAEGFTGAGFETFILIQNPNGTDVVANVTYMLDDGTVLACQHTIPADSRYTIAAQNAEEVGLDQAFSTKVEASQPVIVERAMYFQNGGHTTIGVSSPASTWYFAEGFTGAGFETYILVQNPNSAAVVAYVTYMLDDGTVLVRQHTITANSRYTIAAQNAEEVGWDQAFSTKVEAGQPVIVERAMYYQNGGHTTIGVSDPASTWYLAEGFTGAGFETYLLIQNPNEAAATVYVSYMLDDGTVLERQHVIAANSRYTIATQNAEEAGWDQAFSTRVIADQDVIVERAMYFVNGAHATIAISGTQE
ncbi:MAG: S8 family serine peptidase [Phycisphaerae bacterium]|nr:S8 family serine peptidase [Phycisphaerae bacterium]